MRKIARFLLLLLARFMRIPLLRSATDALGMFLAALIGKGGGSGWDNRGQTKALAFHIKPRPKMVVLDVGANNGAWSSNLSKMIKNHDPHFYLFECAPYCFEVLQNRTDQIHNPTIIHKAVSNEVGEIKLYLPSVGSGLASVHKRQDTSIVQHEYDELLVQTITIDAYIEDNSIDKVDILKIDVEGHELKVLMGAKKCFDKGIIELVQFEFGSANINSRTYFRDFWNFFKNCNFKVFRIIPGGYCLEIIEYDDNLEYFRGCSNYIAVKL